MKRIKLLAILLLFGIQVFSQIDFINGNCRISQIFLDCLNIVQATYINYPVMIVLVAMMMGFLAGTLTFVKKGMI